MTKAWIVREPEEGYGTVVFNDHGLAARRMGAEELELDFYDVECNRAKEFDKYEGPPSAEILIKEHGWFWECAQCGQMVCDEEDNLEEAVFTDHLIYCSKECQEIRQKRVDRVNQEFEDFQISLLNAWCKWDFVKFRGGWPILTPTAYFTFPGAEHGGGEVSIRGSSGKTTFQVYVANGDIEAYRAWEQGTMLREQGEGKELCK